MMLQQLRNHCKRVALTPRRKHPLQRDAKVQDQERLQVVTRRVATSGWQRLSAVARMNRRGIRDHFPQIPLRSIQATCAAAV
jgi:hypothetical protein